MSSTQRVRRGGANGPNLTQALQHKVCELLTTVEQPLVFDTGHRPFVVLTVGVNGAGKTTTIGKLAARLSEAGRSVMLAAGDTFRAGAIEQVRAWAGRTGCSVVAQAAGADPAAVVFDALESARARTVDVVLADTAGRLHTAAGLMDQLRKIRRVMARAAPSAPHETLLVLDATQGPKRAGTGQGIPRGPRRDGSGDHKAGWHGKRRHTAGDRARTGPACPLHRHR